MFDWFLPTTQSVFATRVLLDLDKTLSANDVSTLSRQQVSYTDALQGTTLRALGTSTVQQLALTGIAMAESGRASSSDGQAVATQLIAMQTPGSGWADLQSPDGTLRGVNTLTTGQAMYALCRLGLRPRVNAAVGSALDWLISQQQENGAWLLPAHDSSVSSSWALLAVACVSNASGTAEFNPLTANGSPKAPVTESFTTKLSVTNTAVDARATVIAVTGGPPGTIVTVAPSSLTLAGDANVPVAVTFTLPKGLPANTSYPFVATVSFAAGGSSAASQVSAKFTAAIGSEPDEKLTATTTSIAPLPALLNSGTSVPLSVGVQDSAGQPVHAGSVTYALDGTVFATVQVTGDNFASNWLVPTLPFGKHTLHAAYLGSSDPVIYSESGADKLVDIEPPVPSAPTVSGVVDGSSSTSGQYNLSGVGTPGDTIAVLANGVLVRTATVNQNGTWNTSFSLSPGAYAIGVVETGPGGSSSPATSQVKVKPSAPAVAGPASGTTFTSMVANVSGVATAGAKIDVLRDGKVVATTIADDAGNYAVGVDLIPGPNDFSVSQTVNGQTGALSGVKYNQTPAAPLVAAPLDPVSSQTSAPITITGKAVPGSTLVLVDNGVVVGSAVAGADGSYAITARLASGQNSLSVTSSVGGVPGAPSRSFVVRVDSDAPFFPAPPVDLFAYAATNSGTALDWPAVLAYDAQDGKLSSKCDEQPGATFPVGTTKVTCSATDSLGNAASTSFVVKVVLQALPTLRLPPGGDIVVKSGIATGANVSFDVTALDAQGKPLAAECSPPSGSFFAAGTTKVTCTATDSIAQTEATSSFDVTVIPVPYYGVTQGAPEAVKPSGGGCSMSQPANSSRSRDLGALAVGGLALATVLRRRKLGRAD